MLSQTLTNSLSKLHFFENATRSISKGNKFFVFCEMKIAHFLQRDFVNKTPMIVNQELIHYFKFGISSIISCKRNFGPQKENLKNFVLGSFPEQLIAFQKLHTVFVPFSVYNLVFYRPCASKIIFSPRSGDLVQHKALGTICVPSSQLQFPESSRLQYTIRILERTIFHMIVSFKSFQFSQHPYCYTDFVNIEDNKKDPKEYIFCGMRAPWDVITSHEVLMFVLSRKASHFSFKYQIHNTGWLHSLHSCQSMICRLSSSKCFLRSNVIETCSKSNCFKSTDLIMRQVVISKRFTSIFIFSICVKKYQNVSLAVIPKSVNFLLYDGPTEESPLIETARSYPKYTLSSFQATLALAGEPQIKSEMIFMKITKKNIFNFSGQSAVHRTHKFVKHQEMIKFCQQCLPRHCLVREIVRLKQTQDYSFSFSVESLFFARLKTQVEDATIGGIAIYFTDQNGTVKEVLKASCNISRSINDANNERKSGFSIVTEKDTKDIILVYFYYSFYTYVKAEVNLVKTKCVGIPVVLDQCFTGPPIKYSHANLQSIARPESLCLVFTIDRDPMFSRMFQDNMDENVDARKRACPHTHPQTFEWSLDPFLIKQFYFESFAFPYKMDLQTNNLISPVAVVESLNDDAENLTASKFDRSNRYRGPANKQKKHSGYCEGNPMPKTFVRIENFQEHFHDRIISKNRPHWMQLNQAFYQNVFTKCWAIMIIHLLNEPKIDRFGWISVDPQQSIQSLISSNDIGSGGSSILKTYLLKHLLSREPQTAFHDSLIGLVLPLELDLPFERNRTDKNLHVQVHLRDNNSRGDLIFSQGESKTVDTYDLLRLNEDELRLKTTVSSSFVDVPIPTLKLPLCGFPRLCCYFSVFVGESLVGQTGFNDRNTFRVFSPTINFLEAKTYTVEKWEYDWSHRSLEHHFLSWYEAWDYCKSQGMILPEIHSSNDMNLIVNKIRSTKFVFETDYAVSQENSLYESIGVYVGLNSEVSVYFLVFAVCGPTVTLT